MKPSDHAARIAADLAAEHRARTAAEDRVAYVVTDLGGRGAADVVYPLDEVDAARYRNDPATIRPGRRVRPEDLDDLASYLRRPYVHVPGSLFVIRGDVS